MHVNSKFLGVLGGMGPLATADFLKKLVENTPGKTDQDHIPIILYGDSSIPDRTMSIEGVGPSPLPLLLRGIKHLVSAGVGAICIPCNSAHFWFKELQQESVVPILHIVDASILQLKSKRIDVRKIGVMSTYGTYRSRVYADALEKAGYTVIEPFQSDFDNLLMPGILCVKANELKTSEALFMAAAQNLFNRGAEIIILGCTEIPLGLNRVCRSQPDIYIDSTEALAINAVNFLSRNGVALSLT